MQHNITKIKVPGLSMHHVRDLYDILPTLVHHSAKTSWMSTGHVVDTSPICLTVSKVDNGFYQWFSIAIKLKTMIVSRPYLSTLWNMNLSIEPNVMARGFKWQPINKAHLLGDLGYRNSQRQDGLIFLLFTPFVLRGLNRDQLLW